MKKLLIIAAVLAVCAGVWFICSREKVPAAAETQAAPAAEAEGGAAIREVYETFYGFSYGEN